MLRRPTPFLSLLFLTPFCSAASQSASGLISQRPSGTGVASAQVVLVDVQGHPKASVLSDSLGRYAIQAPSSGKYKMLVAASGFESLQIPELSLERNQVTPIDIKLSAAHPSTQLEKITVTAERPVVAAPYGNTHKYDQFLMRRKLGIGTFLTREQIEAKPVSQTAQIFQGIPGLKVTQHGTSWFIHSVRCASQLSGGGGPGSDNMDEDNPTLFPILFIDGFHVKGLSTLQDINPSQIEAIEVYQGAAQLPGDAKGNACAAIYVWLKGGM
jgi:hypothetical protein